MLLQTNSFCLQRFLDQCVEKEGDASSSDFKVSRKILSLMLMLDTCWTHEKIARDTYALF